MSEQKIKPLGDRILVKRRKAVTEKGGILLPETAKEKPRRGEVIAIGDGKRDDTGKVTPLNLKVGDEVLFGAYAGSEVKEEDLLIMTEDDVLAIVE